MLSEYGSFEVNASIAEEASPVEGVVVRIVGADDDNAYVLRTLITDADGRTEKINLPTKNRTYSLAPNGGEVPYSKYNLEITKDGFYTKHIDGVSVFSGIESIQIVSMIPRSDKTVRYFPEGNINITIPDSLV